MKRLTLTLEVKDLEERLYDFMQLLVSIMHLFWGKDAVISFRIEDA